MLPSLSERQLLNPADPPPIRPRLQHLRVRRGYRTAQSPGSTTKFADNRPVECGSSVVVLGGWEGRTPRVDVAKYIVSCVGSARRSSSVCEDSGGSHGAINGVAGDSEDVFATGRHRLAAERLELAHDRMPVSVTRHRGHVARRERTQQRA